MTRRDIILLALAAAPLRADSASDAWDRLAVAAAALTEGDAAAFLNCFDPRMSGYERLREDVTALVRLAEPHNSIELVSNEGDDAARRVEADWTMQIVDRQDSVTTTERTARVVIRVENQGKRWRIAAFDPPGFFAPPQGSPAR